MTDHIEPILKPSPRDFNLMVLGQIISILGSTLLRFALSLYVLDVTGSEAIFATLYAVSNIPMLLAPVGGAIADRFNRRNLMVIFDFTSSAIVLCLIFFMAAGNTSILLIGAVMVLLSIVSALYTPAVTASIPLLVEREKLEGANGLVQAVQALSGVIAPIMGGILYGALGVQALVIVSCIAFFLSAVMEIFIRIPFTKRESGGPMIGTIGRDLKEGFRYVVSNSFIRKAMILAALLNLLLTPYILVGCPIVFRVTMQSSDAMYGIGMGLINAATILGALLVGVLSKGTKIRTVYRWFGMIAALTIPMAVALMPFLGSVGFYPVFILFLAGIVPISMICSVLNIYIITKVQKLTPNENLGKVMAIIMAVAQCMAPIGQILYGLIFQAFSATVYIPTLILTVLMLGLTLFTKGALRNEKEPV